MTEKEREQRIKEIKKQLKYCEERDKVCCAFGSEQEIAELERELEELLKEEELEDFDNTFNKLCDNLDKLTNAMEEQYNPKQQIELHNATIELGKEVYLSDPCYDISTWCQDWLRNVRSGKWLVNYEYNEYNDGAKQEIILSLAHEDYGMAIFEDYYDKKSDSCTLCVDSGTFGVFDGKYYEEHHFENTIDDEWYENNIINSGFRRGLNITDGKGLWVNTSYGDGEYSAELYSKDGEIVGIEIIL